MTFRNQSQNKMIIEICWKGYGIIKTQLILPIDNFQCSLFQKSDGFLLNMVSLCRILLFILDVTCEFLNAFSIAVFAQNMIVEWIAATTFRLG